MLTTRLEKIKELKKSTDSLHEQVNDLTKLIHLNNRLLKQESDNYDSEFLNSTVLYSAEYYSWLLSYSDIECNYGFSIAKQKEFSKIESDSKGQLSNGGVTKLGQLILQLNIKKDEVDFPSKDIMLMLLEYLKPDDNNLITFDIFEHTLSYSGSFDLMYKVEDESWYIQKTTYGRITTEYTNKSLLDVLKYIAKHHWKE